jgi:diadenosine tetraphosphate (Ap4A) HIT family hydrolase
MSYDANNVFAKILRGEIPCGKVYENEHALAFNDLHPQAPTHVLVIPKGAYVNHADFAANAGEAEIAGFEKALGKVAEIKGLVEGGYRLISNCGNNGGQEVPHYHVHVLGGRALGRMLPDKGQ